MIADAASRDDPVTVEITRSPGVRPSAHTFVDTPAPIGSIGKTRTTLRSRTLCPVRCRLLFDWTPEGPELGTILCQLSDMGLPGTQIHCLAKSRSIEDYEGLGSPLTSPCPLVAVRPEGANYLCRRRPFQPLQAGYLNLIDLVHDKA